jgi:hypothetical protein
MSDKPALQPVTPAAAVGQMIEAFRPAAEAWRTGFGQFMAAMKPVAEWAERHPEELARWQAEREAEQLVGSCHCLCGTHDQGARGVCVGVAEPGLTVHFDSPTTGPTDVPMCRSCYNARQLVGA